MHRSSVILEEDEEDWRAQRDTQLERIRAMKLARRELVEVAPGKPEARRVDGEVRVVGEDGETDSLDGNFGALGLV